MLMFDQSDQITASISAGIGQLGAHVHQLTPEHFQLSNNTPAKDNARLLSRMVHAIGCRNLQFGIGHNYLSELAKWASIPVLSLQDDVYHPIAALADLMTIREFSGTNIGGLKVAISWVYSQTPVKPLSTVQSHLLLLPRFGIDVTIAMPEEFPLNEKIVHRARNHAQLNGCKMTVTDNMEEAFDSANMVIPVNWGGFAWFNDFVEDREHHEQMNANLKKHKDWICDMQRMNLADPYVKYMHPFPVDVGYGVTENVIKGPFPVVYDQAENCLHTAKAIMALTMGGR
jgi:ornithine carbamoyltransferase